ncbi:MAG: poly-gamma-glutamate synthase PgsB, partial [Myxococcales bacterium]|nr:poly-gamma-glutamate synthase PgsB [Myxococcales bacterium]
RANVLEQIRIVRAAADAGAQALVVECMALQPELQWLCEARLVQSQVGVITNARPDHLDVMGPTPDDVARALAGTVPYGGTLYTAEGPRRGTLARAAADRGSRLVAIEPADVAAITAADQAGFSYLEHPENIALALRVCVDQGVDRATALAGMHAAAPDPGALREVIGHRMGRPLVFVNAFAANDPQSTLAVWRLARQRHPRTDVAVVLMNTRADRADRSRQLGEAAPDWQADRILVSGDDTGTFIRAARGAGVPAAALMDLGGERPTTVLHGLDDLLGEHTLVVGVGNIGGAGFALAKALGAPA